MKYDGHIHKKSLPLGRLSCFVFAFFITRRNASQLGEGKKECEEKHFIENHYGLPILKLTVSKK
ncbi:hypothetical protein C6W03_20340 [Yersinia pestis]|nr:hypothetical protein C6W03_20340 [Yersinia pestis]